MGNAPLRYCAAPKCPNKVRSGLCPEHQHSVRQTHKRHVMSTPGVNYGRRWQKQAKAFLEAHPFCIDCLKEEMDLGLATEVDHEIPHKGNAELFWDSNNWRPRCKRHHSMKTAKEVQLGGAHV